MIVDIRKNLEEITAAIKAASKAEGYPPATLVAVSKSQPVWKLEAALEAGQKVFGENRVQEAEKKWPDLKGKTPRVELRLIGPLQTNKVKLALKLFDVIETLDRPKLARALSKEFEKGSNKPRLYIQVNTGEEPQKAGVVPADLPEFYALCKELSLPIEGLMCIPPYREEPSMHFALLKKLAQKIGVQGLSMGMSNDYEKACRLGATSVRVGTAVFGPREKTIKSG